MTVSFPVHLPQATELLFTKRFQGAPRRTGTIIPINIRQLETSHATSSFFSELINHLIDPPIRELRILNGTGHFSRHYSLFPSPECEALHIQNEADYNTLGRAIKKIKPLLRQAENYTNPFSFLSELDYQEQVVFIGEILKHASKLDHSLSQSRHGKDLGAESLKFLFQNSIPIIHINIKDHEDINRLQLQGKFLAQAIESLLKQGSLKKLNVRNIARDIAAYIYPWNEKTAKMLVDQITYIERKSSPYGKLDQANHLIW